MDQRFTTSSAPIWNGKSHYVHMTFIPYMFFNMVRTQVTVLLTCLCKSLRLRCSQNWLVLLHFFLLNTPQALLINLLPSQFVYADRTTVTSCKAKVQEPVKQKSIVNIITFHPDSQTKIFVVSWKHSRACWQQLKPISVLSRNLEKSSLIKSCTVFTSLHVKSNVWQSQEIVTRYTGPFQAQPAEYATL